MALLAIFITHFKDAIADIITYISNYDASTINTLKVGQNFRVYSLDWARISMPITINTCHLGKFNCGYISTSFPQKQYKNLVDFHRLLDVGEHFVPLCESVL